MDLEGFPAQLVDAFPSLTRVCLRCMYGLIIVLVLELRDWASEAGRL